MSELEPPPTPLHRRNTIATAAPLPEKLTLPMKPLHTSSLPNGDVPWFELITKSSASYTSLKDIIPSAAVANSPTAGSAANSPTTGSAAKSAYEICIRNRLVKQAAWAYLQPMSASPDSSGPHFLHRIWMTFSSAQNSISSCLRLINSRIIHSISCAIDRILGVFRVHVNR